MPYINIHNVEKVEIDKFWLDSETFVLKMKFINNKNEKTEIVVFSKHSEPFNYIEQIKPVKLNSKSE